MTTKLYAFFHAREIEVFNCKKLYAHLLPKEWHEFTTILGYVPQNNYYITKKGRFVVDLESVFNFFGLDKNKIIDSVTYREKLYA